MKTIILSLMLAFGLALQAQTFNFACASDVVATTLTIHSGLDVGSGVAGSVEISIEEGTTVYNVDVPLSDYFLSKERVLADIASSNDVSIQASSVNDGNVISLVVTLLSNYNYDTDKVFPSNIPIYNHIKINFTSEELSYLWGIKGEYDDLYDSIYSIKAAVTSIFSGVESNQQDIIDVNNEILELNVIHDANISIGKNIQALDSSRKKANDINDELQALYQAWLND